MTKKMRSTADSRVTQAELLDELEDELPEEEEDDDYEYEENSFGDDDFVDGDDDEEYEEDDIDPLTAALAIAVVSKGPEDNPLNDEEPSEEDYDFADASDTDEFPEEEASDRKFPRINAPYWKTKIMECSKNPVSAAAIVLVAIIAFTAGGCGSDEMEGDVGEAKVSASGDKISVTTTDGKKGEFKFPKGTIIQLTTEQKEAIRAQELAVAEAEALREFSQAQLRATQLAVEEQTRRVDEARDRADKRVQQILDKASGDSGKAVSSEKPRSSLVAKQ